MAPYKLETTDFEEPKHKDTDEAQFMRLNQEYSEEDEYEYSEEDEYEYADYDEEEGYVSFQCSDPTCPECNPNGNEE